MSDQNDLPEAAKRALAEAEERRKKAKELELPKELGAYNLVYHRLDAERANAETTNIGSLYPNMDYVSNGFKIRGSGNVSNGSGQTYIYLAFASSPLVGSDGVPTTAR
jgi:hypothetical protein